MRRPLRRRGVAKACRNRFRLDSRHRAAASAGERGCLPTFHSFPAHPRHYRSALPPPQPSTQPLPPGPRRIEALRERESIETHPRPRCSHLLFARRDDYRSDSATSHSNQTPQSALPTPAPYVFPCRNSSRKSSRRSDTCSSYPFPHPQTRRP